MSELSRFRHSKDHFLKHDPDSLLGQDREEQFRGLSYFDDNPELRFELELDEFETQAIVELQTSSGEPASYVRWGRITFEVDGNPAHLTVFKATDGADLFLPFADATTGRETWGDGRYLDIVAAPNGRALVDFNYAYNPFCAYGDGWSCPLTPPENRLRVPIRAGEKSYR